MATLFGSEGKKSASISVVLSVSNIFLEDTVREPNVEPMKEEFVKVDIVYRFIRNNKEDSLSWDMNIVEPSGQDCIASDIKLLVKHIRQHVKRSKKITVDVFDEENSYEMFNIVLGYEPGYINKFELTATGSWFVDDELVMRLFPKDRYLLDFADQLEKELAEVISESKAKFPERVKKNGHKR